MSNEKLTKNKLDLLIERMLNEENLNEAEYVTGAEMPKQKGKFDFGEPWFGNTIQSTPQFMNNITRVADFCRGAEKKFSGKMDLGNRFKRTMAIEMLHKFLTIAIPETDMMGFNPFHSGFGLETMIANLFRGEVIDGEADDIIFKSKRVKSQYSLKFYSEASIKKYGFGQALGTIGKWLETRRTAPTPTLKYVIFVKISEKDRVGFKVYFKKFTKKDIKLAFENKIYELEQQASTDSPGDEVVGVETGLTPEDITKIKNTVVLYKGTLDEMEYIDEILLPRDISELMKISFRELGEDIKTLYTSLNNFKEAMVEYHKGEQTKLEREKSLKTYEALKQAADKNLNISDQSGPLVEKENKQNSKKDLDKLIEEVILNKNK